MKRYVFMILLIISPYVNADLKNECVIANNIFKDAGSLIVKINANALGPNNKKFADGTVTDEQWAKWSQETFIGELDSVVMKYQEYTDVDLNSPISLGMVLILRVVAYFGAVDEFIKTKDTKQIDTLKIIMEDIGTNYKKLKVKCGK